MSQESVDVVRRVYQGFGRDLAAPIGEADLVASLRDGRIVRIVVYFDGAEALEAAGLDEL